MATYILAEHEGGTTKTLKEGWEYHDMKPDRKKAIGAAVTRLVEAKDYRTLKAQLLRMIAQNAVVPLRFAGELEVLNPLVELGISNPLQFEQVFNLITVRRREKALYYEQARRSKRNDYMKEYMRQYRAEQKKGAKTPRGAAASKPAADSSKSRKNDDELNAILNH